MTTLTEQVGQLKGELAVAQGQVADLQQKVSGAEAAVAAASGHAALWDKVKAVADALEQHITLGTGIGRDLVEGLRGAESAARSLINL